MSGTFYSGFQCSYLEVLQSEKLKVIRGAALCVNVKKKWNARSISMLRPGKVSFSPHKFLFGNLHPPEKKPKQQQ